MYEGVEDKYQAYNICAEKLGSVNEWKDKEYPWDVLVKELN
jgi:hypothetical protein